MQNNRDAALSAEEWNNGVFRSAENVYLSGVKRVALPGADSVECFGCLYHLECGAFSRRCKVCGKYFLAKRQRYELCSDKCRKAQALQNKREFDERARENNYDLLYKNECQNWRNKINKAKRTAGFPADQLEEMLTAFEAFKKEALKRKKAVKEKTASPKEFTDWLYQQSNIIINLSVY